MEITKEELKKIREHIDYCQDKEGYYIDNVDGLLDLIIKIFGTKKQKEKQKI